MSSHDPTEVGSGPATPPPATASKPDEYVRGAAIGRYLVLERLGQGGMGVVWSAYDPELDRKLALKLLHGGTRSATPPMRKAFGKVMNALFGDEAVDDTVAAPGLDRDQQRLLREAQAAARINHPNVVTVHDVGQHRGQVFVAMEFVAGVTLRQWLARQHRSWREVVEVMIAAAQGLAAAHAHGLVHRDFKPDNLMIGDDGRVRVMDFGLVRPEGAGVETGADELRPTTDALALDLTAGGLMVGTPAYMSPEQHRGQVVDARSDQFSFCVALWEGLFGLRPFRGDSVPALAAAVLRGDISEVPSTVDVPTALRRVVERGLAVDPALRWPDMRTLATELRRDPLRARRWALRGTVVASIAAASWGTFAVVERTRLEACHRAAQDIASSWNPEVAAAIDGAIAATGVAYAADTAQRVRPQLDAWAQQWSAQQDTACIARLERRTEAVAIETLDCLADARRSYDAAISALRELDVEGVRHAGRLVGGLTSPTGCSEDGVLLRRRFAASRAEASEGDDPARAEVLRAQTQLSLGHVDAAVAILEPVVAAGTAARATVGDATYELGRALSRRGEFPAAERVLNDAVFLRIALGDEPGIAAATAELIDVVGYRQARPDDARLWARWARTLIERIGAQDDLQGAALDDRVGNFELSQGHAAEGAARLTHALEVKRARLGAGHPEVALSLNMLGNAHMQTDGVDAALADWREALAILENALGPEHPDLQVVLNNLAQAYFRRGDPAMARDTIARGLALQLREQGPDHPDLARTYGNLAMIEQSAGDLSAAREHYARAATIMEASLGPEHRSLASLLASQGKLEVKLGNIDDGIALERRALAIQERNLEPGHIEIAVTLSALGDAFVAKQDLDGALPWYERSLAVCEAAAPGGHPLFTPIAAFELGNLQRRRGELAEAELLLERALAGLVAKPQAPKDEAEARRALGLVLWARAIDRVRARALLEQARGVLEPLGEHDEVAEIDAVLAGASATAVR
ncbi:MAG: serine/threonine protein kinase [Deltaproteobacteria bacterium]|nr:serine/threonine protein kinase [Deltaproteobacteria bacterium]MBP7287034.1 serine/threonine protein kinase [Nannocystaceae bacterium]